MVFRSAAITWGNAAKSSWDRSSSHVTSRTPCHLSVVSAHALAQVHVMARPLGTVRLVQLSASFFLV